MRVNEHMLLFALRGGALRDDASLKVHSVLLLLRVLCVPRAMARRGDAYATDIINNNISRRRRSSSIMAKKINSINGIIFYTSSKASAQRAWRNGAALYRIKSYQASAEGKKAQHRSRRRKKRTRCLIQQYVI